MPFKTVHVVRDVKTKRQIYSNGRMNFRVGKTKSHTIPVTLDESKPAEMTRWLQIVMQRMGRALYFAEARQVEYYDLM